MESLNQNLKKVRGIQILLFHLTDKATESLEFSELPEVTGN